MKRLVELQITIYLFILLVSLASAESKTFIKEYTYQASEQDSKLSCRNNALTQVKRLLLEELGAYLESYTEVKNYELSKDNIYSITSGVVKTQVIDEKWDGKNYWIKAMMDADPDEVAKSINKNQNEIKNANIRSIRSEKEYRISFYSVYIDHDSYGNKAPVCYILAKDTFGGILFNTGDVYIKQKKLAAILKKRRNYNPNFQGVGFNHMFDNNCISFNLMDWKGCEGLICKRHGDDVMIGSEYKLCVGDRIGKRWVKSQGWQMEIEVLSVE